jgi:NAD(P)-dependent dehydrogenase (short-subunit alcohol dehydrogenase family)
MEIALVTGGNRGLGFEACRQLARRGLRVILTSRDLEQGRAAAARLSGDGEVAARCLDVADPVSVADLAAQLGRDGVRLAALVNNAGASFRGFDADVAERTLATNYFGAAAVTDALAPLVPGHGRIVMVSSGMGELSVVGPELRARLTAPDLDRAALDALMREFVADVRADRHRDAGWPANAYSVSKVGMNALVRLLAPPWRERGVLVNAVCPGWVRTDMGGPRASRSVEEGARGIVWAATLPPDGPTGGFFRDGRPLPW